MAGISQNRKLYLGVALLSAGVVIAASGGGLFGSETYWISDWQHRLFQKLCHQDPARSFRIAGTPMAVCSRCFGIYASFATAWFAMPLLGFFADKTRSARMLLIAAVALNVLDAIGNLLGFWQNTLESRFILGMLIGVSAVLLLSGSFITIKPQTKRGAYGYDGTAKYRT